MITQNTVSYEPITPPTSDAVKDELYKSMPWLRKRLQGKEVAHIFVTCIEPSFLKQSTWDVLELGKFVEQEFQLLDKRGEVISYECKGYSVLGKVKNALSLMIFRREALPDLTVVRISVLSKDRRFITLGELFKEMGNKAPSAWFAVNYSRDTKTAIIYITLDGLPLCESIRRQAVAGQKDPVAQFTG
jgi:hypothetical protein